jgi:hypothetical protein
MGSKKRFHRRHRSAAEPPGTDPRKSSHNDPVERLIEWQEHRYDPGYFTGANIHPLLRGPRPNKYGYLLMVVASMTAILTILSLRAGVMPLYQAFVIAPFLLLIFLAGFKLIRGRRAVDPWSR